MYWGNVQNFSHIKWPNRLGSGLVIFKRRKTGYAGGTEVPMRTLFYLSESQLERIKPFFPRSHGAPRVDDRRVVSGIIYVIKHGLQWQDAPDEYGPTKRCTIALSGGAGSVFSIKFSLSWQMNHLLMAPW